MDGSRPDDILRGGDGAPLRLYHGGGASIDMFRPLTHFGTLRAATDRLAFDGYLDEASPRPGAVVYAVNLRMRNPLEVEDLGNFTVMHMACEIERRFPGHAGFGRAVLTAVAEKEKLTAEHWTQSCVRAGMIDRRLLIARGEEAARQAAAISPHRFVDQVWSDFDIGAQGPEGFVRNVCFPQDNAAQQGRPTQMVVSALEKLGFDGLVYVNRYEDRGARSWVILRPQQVVPASGARQRACRSSAGHISPLTSCLDEAACYGLSASASAIDRSLRLIAGFLMAV